MTGEGAPSAPGVRRFLVAAGLAAPVAATVLAGVLVLGLGDARVWAGVLGLTAVLGLAAVATGRQVVAGLVVGAMLGGVLLAAVIALLVVVL